MLFSPLHPLSSNCRAKSKKRAFTQYAKKYESKAEIEEALDELRKHASVIRVLAHTQMKKVELRQRKAHLMEIQVGCCRGPAARGRNRNVCELHLWLAHGGFACCLLWTASLVHRRPAASRHAPCSCYTPGWHSHHHRHMSCMKCCCA